MRRRNPSIIEYLKAPQQYPWIQQSADAPPVYPGLERVGPGVGKLLDNLRIQPGGRAAAADMPMGPAGVIGQSGAPTAQHMSLSQVLAPPIPDGRPIAPQQPWGMAPSQPIMEGNRQVGRFDSGVEPATSLFPVQNSADAANAANPLRVPRPAAPQPQQPSLADVLFRLVYGMRQPPGSGR